MSDGVDLPVMPRDPSDSIQVSCRVPKAWVADFDAVAKALSRPGLDVTKTDAIRACLARGLLELKAELKVGKGRR